MKVKLKPGFIIREVAGEQVLIPIGMQSVDFTKMLVLNDTALLLVNSLMSDEFISSNDLTEKILEHYEVQQDQANTDVNELLEKLQQLNMLVLE